MNKIKSEFMQNAPKFVIETGQLSLIIFTIMGFGICFTDEWRFGIFATILCLSAFCFIRWVIKRQEKISGISVEDAIERNKKYWQSKEAE